MKLKFEKEVQVVIDAVAALPETTTDEELMKKPGELIRAFDKQLVQSKTSKDTSMKTWAKQRRQLSFMFEFVKLSTSKGVTERFAMEEHAIAVKVTPDKPIPELTTEEVSKDVAYYAVVKFFKDIKSGNLLKKIAFVRLAIAYGVIHLSDQELQLLVDNNKV